MAFNFRRSNETYSITGKTFKITGTEQIKTPYALCYRQGGTTYYIPLTNGKTYLDIGDTIKSGSTYYRATSASATSPQFLKVRVDGQTYNALDPSTLTSQSYAIPAGTYTPTAFKNMILSFIASGSSRNVASATSFKVNGSTVSLSSGGTIRYQTVGSSPYELEMVTFGRQLASSEFWKPCSSFTIYKAYCVYSGSQGTQHTYFATYSNFSITVNSSFNFS